MAPPARLLPSQPGRLALSLARNFLHAAALQFQHPRTGEPLSFSAPLPAELEDFLQQLGGQRDVWGGRSRPSLLTLVSAPLL